ncbi:hypothetical protein GCM10025782_11660 [Pedococcus ginsenosidimutans]|uniref:Uncharacterized protein n=1 Tax=Pedococcus ginsenosidimutans TaxID=490570 RepID=A0ABP8XYL5_9MICO
MNVVMAAAMAPVAMDAKAMRPNGPVAGAVGVVSAAVAVVVVVLMVLALFLVFHGGRPRAPRSR